MDKIDHAGKGRLINIKENLYIYSYKHNNKLIDEQKAEENNRKNMLFDVAIQYVDTTLLNRPYTYKVLTISQDISSLPHIPLITMALQNTHTHNTTGMAISID
jgi:hypothetical protein